MTIKELEQQIRALTFVEKAQILRLLLRDFTAFWTGGSRPANGTVQNAEEGEIPTQGIGNELSADDFELLADQLTDEFARMVGASVPLLPDHAITRAGIYEGHA